MKVKVILRAPKSQIPLQMTVNNAKYGDKNVSATLDVVNSDEVVRWVNDTAKSPELSLSDKQKIIDLKGNQDIGCKSSQKEEGNGSPKHLKSLDEDAHFCRHRYKNISIRDLIPAYNITSNEDNKTDPSNNENDVPNNEGNIENEVTRKYEKLLSGNIGERSTNSGMGASGRTKYNGREMTSNIRSKPSIKSIFKNFRSYDHNKRFKSNGSHHSSDPISVDPKTAEAIKVQIISKKIQKEIDTTSKVESVQRDILKTFQNLTVHPSLYLPEDKNKGVEVKELPKTRLLPLSSVLPFQNKNSTRSKSPTSLQSQSIQSTPSNLVKNFKIVGGHCSFDDLSNAISKLNLELSNTASVLDNFLSKDKHNPVNVDDHITKNILEQLYDLELFYNKIHFLLLNKKNMGNCPDSSGSGNLSGFQNSKNPGKLPNTSLPRLSNSSVNAKADNTTFNFNDEEKKCDLDSAAVEKNQSLNRIDSKRSLSIPLHEEEFINSCCSSYYDNNEYYDYDNRNLNVLLKDKNNPRNTTPSTIINNNQVPQSKVGLKPKSTYERSSQGEVIRGRTKMRDQKGNGTRVFRNFISENKQNVLQNARKSSSSLQILSNRREGSNPMKNPPLVHKNQINVHQNGKNPSFLRSRNQSFEHRRFGGNCETYPSLEVGGPIAKMNGFSKYISCLQNNCYPPQFKHHQPNYQYKTDYGPGYFLQNHEIDYTDSCVNTRKCPFFCNVIPHN
ncbi:hypothetical protein FG386_000693 [Cryptosporidium ryanae]|uniref:uncharacterized protein n=1 Tax=Cryptosporidium ryanae TaxID=515981 RepID=UPI003519E5B9|nr:hypothetical protein FG386_000693 [Cryptosporidium ryanae]